MNPILSIPEIQSLDSRRHLIRIPDELDVPVTDRVRELIDTPEFRRLAHISQLGLVALVYPAANHTRFEHSLGVYRNALLYLKQLAHDPRFVDLVSVSDAETFIVAALLHDVGHWPFCHPIEDMHLPGLPEHEQFAERYVLGGELAQVIRESWGIDPGDLVALLNKRASTPGGKVLGSLISGPVDIDKMDYLYRDSLHAGVPYGKNFDQQRLMGSLCLNEAGDGLALTEKGKTAAEMMVFGRYVMFSEVYWHHTVRSATAMLQRAFYILKDGADLTELFRCSEAEMIRQMFELSAGSPAQELLEGLFGARRVLYKRMAQFSHFENPNLYARMARQPFDWLVKCGKDFGERLGRHLGQAVEPHEVLIDAPPVKLEVQFNVQVYFAKQNCYRQLSEVSPVVQTLAQTQFDDYVKRVRIFLHPRLIGHALSNQQITALLEDSLSSYA